MHFEYRYKNKKIKSQYELTQILLTLITFEYYKIFHASVSEIYGKKWQYIHNIKFNNSIETDLAKV